MQTRKELAILTRVFALAAAPTAHDTQQFLPLVLFLFVMVPTDHVSDEKRGERKKPRICMRCRRNSDSLYMKDK